MQVGAGSQALEFELYEAKALEKKTELHHVMFRLAEHATDLQKQLDKANQAIEGYKQQKTVAGVGGGAFVIGGKVEKEQPKAQPKQAGMSAINPHSKKRKAARGVKFD